MSKEPFCKWCFQSLARCPEGEKADKAYHFRTLRKVGRKVRKKVLWPFDLIYDVSWVAFQRLKRKLFKPHVFDPWKRED